MGFCRLDIFSNIPICLDAPHYCQNIACRSLPIYAPAAYSKECFQFRVYNELKNVLVMTDQELNSLLDQAMLDMMINAESPSSKEETSASEYTEQDYAKLLADIASEDEDLAKAEIHVASESEETGEEADFLLEDVLKDDFFAETKFEYKNGKIEKIKSDKVLFTIGRNDQVIDIADEPAARVLELPPSMEEDKLNKAKEQKKESRALQKIKINRMAFNQKILPLASGMTRWDKTVLVEELTKNLRVLIKRYDAYINSRVARLLLPAIPRPIKLAKLKWPWAFIANPGFLYRTHPESGEILTYWVTPNIPYYFKQGTEQTVLEERDAILAPYFLESIDRAIHRWYEARRRLANKEVAYAVKIVNNDLRTYMDLLNYNPFWFKKLYDRAEIEQRLDAFKRAKAKELRAEAEAEKELE